MGERKKRERVREKGERWGERNKREVGRDK